VPAVPIILLYALQLAPEDSPVIEEIEKEIYNIYKGKLDN
jgi:hypothetical protein